MLKHLPNAICIVRIVLTVPTVLALEAQAYEAAVAWFALAAASDGLDGYLAKKFGWTSELGRVLDPLADKILLVAVFMTCVWQGLVPTWLAVAAIARDLLLTSGAIAYRLWFGALRGAPSILSKINTALQIAFLLGALLTAMEHIDMPDGLQLLGWVTLFTTVASGLDYAWRFLRLGWQQLAVH